VGLSYFSPRQFGYGVCGKPWGRWQRFEIAFLVGSLGNNAFVREGKARFPIKKMFGPSIPKEMIQDATRAAFEAAQPNVLAARVRHFWAGFLGPAHARPIEINGLGWQSAQCGAFCVVTRRAQIRH
jgi:hypothetical protein